jgi:hypothetical protein
MKGKQYYKFPKKSRPSTKFIAKEEEEELNE